MSKTYWEHLNAEPEKYVLKCDWCLKAVIMPEDVYTINENPVCRECLEKELYPYDE